MYMYLCCHPLPVFLLHVHVQWPASDQENVTWPTRKLHGSLPGAVNLVRIRIISCTIHVHLWTVFILTTTRSLLTGSSVMTAMTGTMWSAQGSLSSLCSQNQLNSTADVFKFIQNLYFMECAFFIVDWLLQIIFTKYYSWGEDKLRPCLVHFWPCLLHFPL